MRDEDWRNFVKKSAVRPLNAKPRANLEKAKPRPRAKNFNDDEYAALLESRNPSSESQIEASGDEVTYLKANQPTKTLTKLKAGSFAIRDSIDLHGYSEKEAKKTVYAFIAHSIKHENLCVRIIHGKGRGSIDRRSIIKESMPNWLMRLDCVVAFCPAPHHDGGTGVTYVLLS